MSAWDLYDRYRNTTGRTKKEMFIHSMRTGLARKMLDSPSCQTVDIGGETQTAVIVHTAETDEKKIFSLPGEHLPHGGIVNWEDNHWIIIEKDANNLIYDKCLMKQCNHILRWISKDGTLKEKWCIVVDGTKYLIGERTRELITIGDARIAVTVAKDDDTIELGRGMRFLIDDEDSDEVLAYQITKSNKMFNKLYSAGSGEGVFRFIMNEVNLTADDNKELRIADYYNWRPREASDSDHVDTDVPVSQIVRTATGEAAMPNDDDKEVWL